MTIGELNKLITLQYETKTSDSMGGYDVTWIDSAEVWAAIWPVSASEQIKSAKETMTITHRIRIRYRSDILSSWRIKYGKVSPRYFNIESIVNPQERNEWLDLICKEVT